jgi:hypothetical protein
VIAVEFADRGAFFLKVAGELVGRHFGIVCLDLSLHRLRTVAIAADLERRQRPESRLHYRLRIAASK